MTSAGVAEARSALERGAWAEAYQAFAEVDPDDLAGADLDAMAEAAWWTSRLDEAIALRQQAHDRYVAEGETRRAAYLAWLLYFDYLEKGMSAPASGWLQRARRLLDSDSADDSAEHGYLALAESGILAAEGRMGEARERIERALEIGHRTNEGALVAMAIQNLGRNLIASGAVPDGIKLLDEAMAIALSGGLPPLFTGWIFCDVLGACFDVADLRRASEWSDAAVRWCVAQDVTRSFHGLCLLYRIQVTTARGSWDEAEQDARRAVDFLAGLHPYLSGEAEYTLGEIHRRRGDLAGAEQAFARAHALGREPQPGLALVRLAQGKTASAVAGVRAALRDPPANLVEHARLLDAGASIFLVQGDEEAASSCCAQLVSLVDAGGSSWVEATAESALGAAACSRSAWSDAIVHLRRARAIWQDLRLPYEAAQARVLMAQAFRGDGDEERARLELEAGLVEFERLGAVDAAEDARARLSRDVALPAGLSPRELEVLRLVASGKTNREIADELVLSEHTVVRHVHNILRKCGVPSRAAATAFAFEHHLV